MTREIGPREKQLREMREAKVEIAAASENVRRKSVAAAKSAKVGAELVERVKANKLAIEADLAKQHSLHRALRVDMDKAAKKRGKPRKARK